METISFAEKPQIIAQGIKRKIPGHWRTNPNPLTEYIKHWQVSAAALRYEDDHEYNIIVAGSLGDEPVYLDSYNHSKYFFHKGCFAHITSTNSAYYIKFFKCVGHKKGEGARLLYFAFLYIISTELRGKNITRIPVVLEPDYTMSEHGQFQGTVEERNRKLIAYYAKLGFAAIDEAKATHRYGLREYRQERPAMETTIESLLQKLSIDPSGATAGGAKQSRRRKNKFNKSRKNSSTR